MKKLTNEWSLSLEQIYMLEIKEEKKPIIRNNIECWFIKTWITNRTMLVHALPSNVNLNIT